MTERLHPFLLLLVLLDLGFVQATGIVSLPGLLPLWLLAAVSPWLRRLQRFRSYRIAWNLMVLLVFGLLLRHATTTGLLHMLEDGLLLAILCQVHLLNNVGARQRADLVFFNSFLIAFVTSYFIADLVWSLLFAAHGVALLLALQANVWTRLAGPWPAALRRQLLRAALRNIGLVGSCTALAFIAWPRDFNRQGWLGPGMPLSPRLETGLGDRIRLDEQRTPRLGDEIVLRVQQTTAGAPPIPQHWRGLAFLHFDGTNWLPQEAGSLGSRFATDLQWAAQRDGSWRKQAVADQPALQVQQLGLHGNRLLLPGNAAELHLADQQGWLLDPKSYGGLALHPAAGTQARGIAFTLRLAAGNQHQPVGRLARARLLQLPEQLPLAARQLATGLRAELPATATAMEIAEHFAEWLQQRRRYQLPGQPGFARSFADFLLGSGAGHCEYFASALALLLRLNEVPCRLIGGYLVHEWDASSNSALARGRDAHAWVEVLDQNDRWRTVDPTPAADITQGTTNGRSLFAGLVHQAEEFWRSIVLFDASSRKALLQQALRIAPWLLLVALLLRWLQQRRWRQCEPAIAALQRSLSRAGIQQQSGETMRELLQRAAALPLGDEQRQQLLLAARAHEALRYGTAAPHQR